MEKQIQDALNLQNFQAHVGNPAPLFKSKRGNFLSEFREFAVRGSVLDMAIGIIMGVAFGRIITSFVDDILMPPIGLLVGRVDAGNLFFSLTGRHFESLSAARAAGAPTINYGLFLNTVFNFLIVAFAIFLLVRQVNRLKRQQNDAPSTKECPLCCSVIPVKATKCAHCTSEVAAAASA